MASSASIVAVGTMAFDTLETPFGRVDKIIGGSVNHFSLAASFFSEVRCVSVIGEDFPQEHLEFLKSRRVDITGVKRSAGKTFHWSGKYEFDLNTAHTLATHLNVFETFNPEVPVPYQHSEVLFLGNTAPHLQMKVLSQMKSPKLVALDTMNFWIESSRDDLVKAISKVNMLVLNEGEIRQLTKEHNLVRAAQIVRSWGPLTVLIKRGEYGAILFHDNEVFCLPGLPLAELKDPTGAGDTFAGGVLGYLCSQNQFPVSLPTLRKAVVYGSVIASFAVQDFGTKRLETLTKEEIEKRYKSFVSLTNFHS